LLAHFQPELVVRNSFVPQNRLRGTVPLRVPSEWPVPENLLLVFWSMGLLHFASTFLIWCLHMYVGSQLSSGRPRQGRGLSRLRTLSSLCDFHINLYISVFARPSHYQNTMGIMQPWPSIDRDHRDDRTLEEVHSTSPKSSQRHLLEQNCRLVWKPNERFRTCACFSKRSSLRQPL